MKSNESKIDAQILNVKEPAVLRDQVA